MPLAEFILFRNLKIGRMMMRSMQIRHGLCKSGTASFVNAYSGGTAKRLHYQFFTSIFKRLKKTVRNSKFTQIFL